MKKAWTSGAVELHGIPTHRRREASPDASCKSEEVETTGRGERAKVTNQLREKMVRIGLATRKGPDEQLMD